MSTSRAAPDLMGTPKDPKANMEQKAAAQPQISHEADMIRLNYRQLEGLMCRKRALGGDTRMSRMIYRESPFSLAFGADASVGSTMLWYRA